jgi:hypothetical protein
LPRYIVINEHEPERCEPMEAGLDHLPEHLEGLEFYCTCPAGRHGFLLFVEGETAEEVIVGLPPEWRQGSEAFPVESFPLHGSAS